MHLSKKTLLGAHTSAAGGVYNALLEGKKIGATTIQLFTSNQRQWKGRAIPLEVLHKWQEILKETDLSHIMSHDSYLINLGSPNKEGLEKSRVAFSEEIERCLALGVSYLNFHPGSALEGTVEQCLNNIVESLLATKPLLEMGNLRLLIETTAGQGTTVGQSFEHLHYIIDRVKQHIPIGICIDTCHIFVAGYDIRTAASWDETLQTFDKLVGLEHLHAFHLNDSLKGLGSKVDRHQPIGKGMIGLDSFRFLMTDPRVKNLPKYLETPGGPDNWTLEIQQLHAFGAEHAYKN